MSSSALPSPVRTPTAKLLSTALWWGAASWLVLTVVTIATPQGLHFFDPVLPLRALTQWQADPSTHWNVHHRVDPFDLSRDRSEWIGWWAPGTSLLMLPGIAAGIQPGHVLRAIAATALLAGTLGWIRWFARFPLPAAGLVFLAVSLPWMRYSSANLFRYSAEALAFAAAPWAFNAVVDRFARPDRHRSLPLAALGFLLGLAYWLKFSLLVTVLAALGALALWWLVGLKQRRLPLPRLHVVAIFLLTLVLAPLAWQILTRLQGSATPLGGPRGLTWSPIDLVFVLANPALAACDAFGPLFFALVFPGLPGFGGKTLTTVAWFGLPGGILLAWLLASAWRRGVAHAHIAIGASAVFAATIALAALRIVGDVDPTPRHLAPVSLAALPVALAEGLHWWRTRGSHAIRAILIAGAALYIVGPLLFGFAYVSAKVASRSSCAVSPHSLALSSLPRDDALVSHLAALHQTDPAAILVVPDPEMTLLWPGRAIWDFAGRDIGEDLQHSYHGVPSNWEWSTSKPVTVHVLSPRGAELPSPLRHHRFVVSAPPWQGTRFAITSGRLLPQ